MNGWSCSPIHGPASITVFSQLFEWTAEAFQKHSSQWLGRAPPRMAQFLSRCRRYFFVWIICSHLKTFKLMPGPRSPTSPVTAQLIFWRWRLLSSCCYANFQERLNERLVVLPRTRSSSYQGVEDVSLDGMKLLKNMQIGSWAVLPQTRPNSLHYLKKPIRLEVMQPFQKHSSWWLGRAPQHSLSRPSSFHGVKHGYRLDVTLTFISDQMNGWSCSSKHGPAQFTMWSQLFVRMAWSSSKTFKI